MRMRKESKDDDEEEEEEEIDAVMMKKEPRPVSPKKLKRLFNPRKITVTEKKRDEKNRPRITQLIPP